VIPEGLQEVLELLVLVVVPRGRRVAGVRLRSLEQFADDAESVQSVASVVDVHVASS